MTAYRRVGMNSEGYRASLSAHTQLNATELTGSCFPVQMDNDPKHNVKANTLLSSTAKSPDLITTEQQKDKQAN